MVSAHALALTLMLAADVGQAFVPAGGAGVSPLIASSGHRGAGVTPTGSRRCRGRGHDTSMASSVAPAPRTKAEKKSEHFKLKDGGMVEFGSGQRVEVCLFRTGEHRDKWVGVARDGVFNLVQGRRGKRKTKQSEGDRNMALCDSSRRGWPARETRNAPGLRSRDPLCVASIARPTATCFGGTACLYQNEMLLSSHTTQNKASLSVLQILATTL